MPGRRALEDEAADDVGVGDGEAERDPGAERVAEDVRRATRRELAAGSSPGRRPCARRSCGCGSAGCRSGRGRAGPRRSTRNALGERRRVRAPGGAATREAVEQQQRHARCPATRTSQRRPSTTMPLMRSSGPRATAAQPRGGAPRCGPGPCAARGPARPAGRSSAERARAGPPCPTDPVLAAQRGHDRPDVDPVRRPEQLLVVLGQARPPGARPSPGAGTRRSRRRRC